MIFRVAKFGILLFACSLASAQPAASDTATPDAPGKEMTAKEKGAKARLDFMFQCCEEYVGARQSDNAKLKVIPKPLLRWTNPHFGVRDGLFVAWVDDKGRPVAAGQVFIMPRSENDWRIEQQSLSDEPMQFVSKSNTPWTPKEPGVKWTKFKTEVLKPSKSKPLRLGQMRALARRFRGENDLTDDDFALRLMPNPMARYADEEKGILDGALFTMVQGTDPELLLQIEAKKNDEGQYEYWWALAAMTSSRLDGYLDGEVVWTKPQNSGSATDTFYFRRLAGGVPFPEE